MRPIALLTDFGTAEWYVAAMKGVMLSRAPRATFVDITHEVPPQDIATGAFILAATVPWFPRGTVFLAAVDPGVGTERILLAAEADGRWFVGPDNGVLALSLGQARTRTIVRLSHRRRWLPRISQTFHARDILAPVAAYLADGGSLRALGVRVERVVPTPLPQPRSMGRSVRGAVVHIDTFGNLITNLPGGLIKRESRQQSGTVRYQRRQVRVVSSYMEGARGEVVALVGSLGLVELAVRNSSAAQRLSASRGDQVMWAW